MGHRWPLHSPCLTMTSSRPTVWWTLLLFLKTYSVKTCVIDLRRGFWLEHVGWCLICEWMWRMIWEGGGRGYESWCPSWKGGSGQKHFSTWKWSANELAPETGIDYRTSCLLVQRLPKFLRGFVRCLFISHLPQWVCTFTKPLFLLWNNFTSLRALAGFNAMLRNSL